MRQILSMMAAVGLFCALPALATDACNCRGYAGLRETTRTPPISGTEVGLEATGSMEKRHSNSREGSLVGDMGLVLEALSTSSRTMETFIFSLQIATLGTAGVTDESQPYWRRLLVVNLWALKNYRQLPIRMNGAQWKGWEVAESLKSKICALCNA